MSTNNSKEQPMEVNYLYLKFGRIRGGDFIYSPESMKVYDQLGDDESSPEYKQLACRCIDLFVGEIFLWWENITVGKEQAKSYIMNYKHN